MDLFFLNDRFVSKEEAKISILDLGLIRGFGVFEYLRTYKRRPFHLLEHLQRLQYSAEHIGLRLPFTFTEIDNIIKKLIKNAPSGEMSIKLIVTGGNSQDQFTPGNEITFAAFIYPAPTYPQSYFNEGVAVITTPLSRSIPTCKTIHYIPALMAMRKGKNINAQEALHVNAKGEILEATTSNFFAFKNGVLMTPHSEELLFGITREVILFLAKEHFPIALQSIAYEELSSCEECFITSSSREVMPISRIDHLQIGTGTAGNRTAFIQKLFTEYTKQNSWPALHIPRYNNPTCPLFLLSRARDG